jgi:hypothetical protein
MQLLGNVIIQDESTDALGLAPTSSLFRAIELISATPEADQIPRLKARAKG